MLRLIHGRAWRTGVSPAASLAVLGCMVMLAACRSPRENIAVIPRTSATLLTEAEHNGVAHAAREAGLTYYWNAPMRDDDVQGQLDLLANVTKRVTGGIILSPDETLPFRTPIHEIVQRRIPTVILGTDLKLPPSDRVSYVLNNEGEGARVAAEYLGRILNGRGRIAIIGIRHQLTTTSERAREIESDLHGAYPEISVVHRSLASATFSQEQLGTEALLRSDGDIQAIIALTDVATRGAFLALQEAGMENKVRLIGFDQDLIVPLATGGIDAIVMQDTNRMGREAVRVVDAMRRGNMTANRVLVSPVLVTRENYQSARVLEILDQRWYAER